MKVNKSPLIVSIVLTVVFVIGAVVCFLLPKFITNADPESPIQVSQQIRLVYDSSYGTYVSEGKLKNVSDEAVTLKDSYGIILYYNKWDFHDKWTEDKSDIVLQPGQELDFSDDTFAFVVEDKVTFHKVAVTVDGTRYVIYDGSFANTTNVIMLFCIIMAVVFLIMTFTQLKQIKNLKQKYASLDALLLSMGGGAYLRATYTDKDESKKAAAKTAGWALGGILGAIFLGGGVFRVYSGSAQMEVVLCKDALYLVNRNAVKQVTMSDLSKLSDNNMTVSDIETKKNKVVIHTVDGRKTLTLLPDKNCPYTAEEIGTMLTKIYIEKSAETEVNGEQTAPSGEDPFTDLKAEGEVAADTADTTDKAATDGEQASEAPATDNGETDGE